MQVRKRVKIKRSQLNHLLTTYMPRTCIPKDSFGRVTSRGRVKGTWNVKFDV
jgi:hypothetical protein